MSNEDYKKWGREILYGNGEIMMGEREGSPRQLKKEASPLWARIHKPIKERKEAWSKKISEMKEETAKVKTVKKESPKKPVKPLKVKKPSKRKTKK
jgi:hypothetical protein